MTSLPETTPVHAGSLHEFSTRDGRYLHLRRVTQDDTVLLTDLLLRLSGRTCHFRYFTFRTFSLEGAWREAERITRGHAGGPLAVVATAPRPASEEAVGVAELVPDAQQAAIGDLAVVVRDDRQRQGIGTALLRHLLTLARSGDVATIRADLLVENRAARRLLDTLGLPLETRSRHGETRVTARLAALVAQPRPGLVHERTDANTL